MLQAVYQLYEAGKSKTRVPTKRSPTTTCIARSNSCAARKRTDRLAAIRAKHESGRASWRSRSARGVEVGQFAQSAKTSAPVGVVSQRGWAWCPRFVGCRKRRVRLYASFRQRAKIECHTQPQRRGVPGAGKPPEPTRKRADRCRWEQANDRALRVLPWHLRRHVDCS